MNYQQYKVPDLRSMCRTRGIPDCKGSHYVGKIRLIELLEENDQQMGGQAGIIIPQAPIVSSFAITPLPPITPYPGITLPSPITPYPGITLPSPIIQVTTTQVPVLPIVSPRVSPTVSPTILPTILPTVSPIVSPIVSPTVSPIVSPRVSPTPQQIPISSLNKTMEIGRNAISLFNNMFRNRPWSEVIEQYGTEGIEESKEDYLFWLSLSDEARQLIKNKIYSRQGPITVNISFTAK